MTQDAAAMGELGERLLQGDGGPPDLPRAAELIHRAAALGDPGATHRSAVLTAVGLGCAQSWDAALDLLQRSAELGWSLAQAQMRLLGEDDEADADANLWGRLRARIDPAAWTTPPAKRVLSQHPRIRAAEAVASKAVCDWIIARGRDRLAPARVYDSATGGPAVENERNNREAELDLARTDLAVLLLQARIAAATGLPFRQMEHPNLLHYRVGQRFARHVDYLDPTAPGFAQEIALKGQRVATFLLYLNEGFEGGETDFPIIGLRHKGGTGDAMFFANVDESSAPDRRTLHAGLPPTRGEKWLFSQFIRGPSVGLSGA